MRYRLLFGTIGLCAAVVLAAGCRSATSTHVMPNPYVGGWDTKKIRGVPITVKVPTHLEVRVIEKRFYKPSTNVEVDAELAYRTAVEKRGATPDDMTNAMTAKTAALNHLVVRDKHGNPLAVRVVRHDMREKDQLFTVDAVRPAAGTMANSSEFTNSKNPQFFSAFNSEVEDKTIPTITSLVPQLPTVLGNLAKAKGTSDAILAAEASDMVVVEHLVAVHVFDVNDPCLTQNVQAFLDTYLNGCTTPCVTPTYQPR